MYQPLLENVIAASDEFSASVTNLFDTWAHILRFGRWIGAESKQLSLLIGMIAFNCHLYSDGQTTPFARRLLGFIFKSSEKKQISVDICMPTFLILLEELQNCVLQNRHEYLDLVVAAYVYFSRICGPTGEFSLLRLC